MASTSPAHPVVASLPAGPVEYRLEGDGPRTVVVFHGGHMRAGLALGENVFADAGCAVLAPSRPGYGAYATEHRHHGGWLR
jgi:dipeptidyl aminopeptidase/acylaminoacyl peptidase